MTSVLDIFLAPLALLWEWVYRLRRAAYHYGPLKSQRFMVPVVSIGNLSFGGTGKTPFTLWLSKGLAQRKKKVMILMRGYKGKLENSSGILSGGSIIGQNPADFGDEAIFLSRRLPEAKIVVGKRRAQNLQKYFREARPDIVLLDDGHQHLQIDRQMNFVLFDSTMPESQFKVAPQGYLREGPTALVDADVVVLGRAQLATPQKIARLKETLRPYLRPDCLMVEMDYGPEALYNDHHSTSMPLAQLKGRKVICVAGIASPFSFYHMVEALGANIIKTWSFPDHHPFSGHDVQAILELASQQEALVITTEKDIVKLRRITDDKRIFFLEIGIHFHRGEELVWKKIESLFP